VGDFLFAPFLFFNCFPLFFRIIRFISLIFPFFVLGFLFCCGVFFLFIYNRSAILSHAVRLSLIISVFSVLLIWSNVNFFKYKFINNIPVFVFNIAVWVARYTFVIIFKYLF